MMSKTVLRSVITEQLSRKLTFQLSKNIHQVARLSNTALTNEQVAKISQLHFNSNFPYSKIRQRRSSLFDEERKKQLNNIARLEKIEVKYVGVPEDAIMIMNRDISTPFNVAQHCSEAHCERSALALVNGQLWDMHRPLEEDCTVELLHFHIEVC